MSDAPSADAALEIRPARASDLEEVAQLHARSWRENYRGSFDDAFLDGDLPGERREVWRARLLSPAEDQLVLLAILDDALLGFACTYGSHDEAWGSFLDNLHVRREAQGTGVGRRLMEHTGRWLSKHHPARGIYLWVLESNTSARDFYERLGARNAEVSHMETHGGSMVRSCRYVWTRPDELATFRRHDEATP